MTAPDGKLIEARITRGLAALEELYRNTMPRQNVTPARVELAYGDARHALELAIEEARQ